jgi:LuxR family maltose regulon positive regulatory protein
MFLLRTKLAIPTLRPDLVNRPRLLKKLNEGVKGKISLLSAPPGFGKTTLLCEWIQQKKFSAAWFSIDEGDNDPASFLAYMIAALQTIDKSWGRASLELLHSPQQSSYESVIIALINSFASFPKKFALVLDDYHLIQTKSIHTMLDFLIDYLPPNMHLVLATRSDPPLSISRLRSLNQLTELRAKDLSFTSDEILLYFAEKLKVDLSIEDITLLQSRTEGWITGLQLAALSMQGRKDISAFVAKFSGDNRYIMDYLMEEVLHRQPAQIQEFLLLTSILDPMSGALCDTVTGQKNSQQMLNMLEKSNLFIFSLDEERNWFRYHRLFADSLRQRLQHKHGKAVPELHRRACEGYDKNGLKYEAVDHALAAGDFDRAAFLLEDMAETVWDRGQQIKLAQWFGRLPKRIISSRPQLCVFYARSLIMSGNQEEAEQCLGSVEQILDSSSEEIVEILPDGTSFRHVYNREEMLGKISAVRALSAMYRGDVPNVIEHSYHALVLLPKENLTWHGVVATMLGMAHGWAGDGDMTKAEKAFLSAISISEKAGNTSFHVFAGLALAGIFSYQGRMPEAEQLCNRLLQIAEQAGLSQTGNVGSIYSILGSILSERDEIDKGMPQIRKGLELAQLSRDLIALQGIRLNMIRVWLIQKEFGKALELIEKIEQDAKKFHLPPWMIHVISAYKGTIMLDTGKLAAASRWAEERRLDTKNKFSVRSDPEHIFLARVLIAQDKPQEAERFLKRLIKNAEEGQRIAVATQMRLVKVLALYAQAKIPAAIDELKHVLTIGEAAGFIHVFTVEGRTIARLLLKILEDEKLAKSDRDTPLPKNYINRILAAFEGARAPEKGAGIDEPLSEREMEVLKLIAAGFTNQEIAERLFISLNTVRTHTKNINSKLDVHSRTQATARAKKLGLI